jgi:thiamine biosynthesis lipoprotein
MKETELIMGMPITIEVVDDCQKDVFAEVFEYFISIDGKFSPYKEASELNAVNNGLDPNNWSPKMKEVMDLCAQTKKMTGGYFNISHKGKIDTSGLVKGWAIYNASKIIKDKGINNFYIEAGGDIQAEGMNQYGNPWDIGIRNPFHISEIVKAISISGQGVATSGTYLRGEHIYSPNTRTESPSNIVSLTVIGPNVFEADRFATAAFAMGRGGINYISALPGFSAYMIDDHGSATYTANFMDYAR